MNIKKKVIKMLLILIASIILALLSNSKVYGYTTKKLNNVTFSYNELGNYIGDVSYKNDLATSSNKNLYCVDHSGNLTDKMNENYIIKAYMEIDGTNVKFYGNWNKQELKGQYIEFESPYAQTIAMMLNYNDNTSGYSHGYGTKENKTKTQKALWYIWDKFLLNDKNGKLDKSLKDNWGSRS